MAEAQSASASPSPMVLRSGPFFDRAAPSAGFLTTFFDEFFEVLQIIFDAPGDQAECIAGIFNKSLRIVGNF